MIKGSRSVLDTEHISLCETLDRILNKGVVIAGEIIISVADIDLVYLKLQVILTSVEAMKQMHITSQPVPVAKSEVP